MSPGEIHTIYKTVLKLPYPQRINKWFEKCLQSKVKLDHYSYYFVDYENSTFEAE